MNDKKAQKGALRRLLAYIFKENKAALCVVVVCVLFSAVGSMASSVFLQLLIDDVITPALANGFDSVQRTFINIIIVMAAVYLLGVIASAVYSQIMARVSQRTLNKIRKQMFAKMQQLPIRFFDENAHGDIMSYYTNDVDTLRQFISQSMVQLLSMGTTILFIVFMMLMYSVWLTLVAAAGAVIMLLVIKKVGGASTKSFTAQQIETAVTEGYIEEIMHGQKVVKVFTHEQKCKEKFAALNGKLRNASEKANYYSNLLMPVLNNVGNIFYVVIALIGVLLFRSGAANLSLTGLGVIEIGAVVGCINLMRQFSQSICQVSQQSSMIAMAIAGAKRIFSLIDEQPEEDDGTVELTHAEYRGGTLAETDKKTSIWAWKLADGSLRELQGHICLDHVNFGYTDDKMILHDISLEAKPGEKVAFVGATGAGKTTITNLINRFYDIQSGEILYDGIDIKQIKKHALRKSLGVVLQDTNLFTGTVADNIRYSDLSATEQEIEQAAKTANAYDFIQTLPAGFETELTSDGANLSQGQRQLLSIARAACVRAPAMILDEATSSIDTRTEALVQKGTDELMKNRTVFVIAHRLSTVQNADKIIVLDHGTIIETGNHDELIAMKGTYYQLYTGAFELE